MLGYDYFEKFRQAEEKYAELQQLPTDLRVKKELPHGILEFHTNWHQFLRGELVPGGRLTVLYDLGRLEGHESRWWLHGLQAYVRFHPDRQFYEAKAFPTSLLYRPPIYLSFELIVPPSTTQVELWFHTAGQRERVYDSRYGQNYWFAVRPSVPADPVEFLMPRKGAISTKEIIKLVSASAFQFERFHKEGDEAVKVSQAFLRAEVEVKNSDNGRAWLDLRVFNGGHDLIQAETVSLQRLKPAAVDSSIFALVYQFDIRSPSMTTISPNPEVKEFEFRIYCQYGGKIYSDEVAHSYSV